MAQNLQLLKRRIKTSNNITQIAKAMEMISASKIKKAQTAANNNKPYAQRISEMTFSALNSRGENKMKLPYVDLPQSPKKLLIAISTNKGLCGSLNTNLNKKLLEYEDKNTMLITVGKKIELFASRLQYELVASFVTSNSLPDYSLTYQLKNLITQYIDDASISEVHILFSEFKSLFTQRSTYQKLLPFTFNSPTENEIEESASSIFEPNSTEILLDLLPYYLEIQIYNALLQAYTSEQAARMMAMQNAKNNASDIAEYLTLVYNKSRQERITNEILDLANSQA